MQAALQHVRNWLENEKKLVVNEYFTNSLIILHCMRRWSHLEPPPDSISGELALYKGLHIILLNLIA
jgi:hypothetical protein